MAAAPITQLIRQATGGDAPPRGTLTQWATTIGTTVATVSRWRGGTIPDSEWWPRLATALNISENDVATASGHTSPEPGVIRRLETIERQGNDVLARLDALEQGLVSSIDSVAATRGAQFDAVVSGVEKAADALERLERQVSRLQRPAVDKRPASGSKGSRSGSGSARARTPCP